MSRRILAGLATVALFLAGCQSEPSGPNSNPEGTQPPGIGGPLPTHIGDANLAAAIEADLTCLYQKAGLLPNESSSLGKFQTIKDALAADDMVSAQSALENLIRFIELKWGQYKGAANVDCDDGIAGNLVSVEALKNQVILRLNVYVNTEGDVCEIPGGHAGTFCQSGDESSFVYFPPAIFGQLTYVSVQKDPPGLTKLQNLFDEYPNYVRILTAPAITFTGDKPLVVVCFNDQVLQNETSLLARLLLGKNHTDPTTGITTFKALAKPNYAAFPEALAQAEALCGAPPQTSAFGISTRTVLGRLANKVLTAVLPKAVQAQFGFSEMAFGGVGGSPEEFSDFGAIDPGMAFGGVGGSPEEFAPPAAAPGAGPALLPVAPPPGAIIGKVSAGDSASASWATVTVATGLGTPVAGAVVTFTLSDPSSTDPDYAADPSAATFCDGTSTLLVGTDATGAAKVPCLRFSTTVGFKNLNATLDPASIDPSACVIGAGGLCVVPSAAGINYLVATVAGDPAKLSVTTAPGGTSAVAGAVMDAQPVIQVQDAGGNPVGPVPGLSVTASVSAGTLGGTTSVITDAEGVATFTDLTLGGLVGTGYTITFSTGALTPATASVTVSGVGPASSLTVAPTSTTAAAGATIPTLTATVKDAFTNPVSGVSVGVTGPTGLSCGGSCSVATDASGNAAFSTLSIGGTVGAKVVTFSATGLSDATATVTLTPGPATAIAVVPPPTGGSYGSGLVPFSTVSPTPTVALTDAYGNTVTSGGSVVWGLTGSDPNNGAVLTPNGTTATWKLGDGGNGLSAYLNTLGSANPAVFSASTATGGIVSACVLSGTQKKNDIGSYANGEYTGRFSFVPSANFRIRKVTLSMSVTGQSSGTGDYPATLDVYAGPNGTGAKLYTGSPTTAGVIVLDGNNGNAQDVVFQMTPAAGSGVAISGQDLWFVLKVTAPSNRTLQTWYNTKSNTANCGSSTLYLPGVIPPASGRDVLKGHLIKLSN